MIGKHFNLQVFDHVNIVLNAAVQVLKQLPWEYVKSLLGDSECGVQSEIMKFLQNMCNSDQSVIQAIMDWSQGELLTMVTEKLERLHK